MTGSWTMLAVLVLSLGSASVTRAEGKVGILEVSTTGVAPEAATRFGESFADGVRSVGFTVVPESRLRDRLAHSSYFRGCHFGPCLRVIEKAVSLKRVLIMQVRSAGSSFEYVASLLDTESGTLRHQVSLDCVACSIEDASSTAFSVGVELMSLATGKIDSAQSSGVSVKAPALIANARRKRLKVTGWVFVGAAAVASAAGAYLITQDEDKAGLATLSGGGVAALSGLTMLVFSRQF